MKKAPPPPGDDDLDFTRPGAIPAPRPAPEVVERATEEAAAGTPQLEQSGFYVSITKRPPGRIPPRNDARYVILVVEDDADLGQMLIDIFMTAGFEVRWASNRAEINTELKHGTELDLVLLDIVLPDADGLQVLERLRQHPRIGNLPVILMTGKSAPHDVVKGLAAGANGYVSKPFKMSALVRAVNEVLGNA